jgi:pyruvate/2-oxoglutarate dehydrogenase complex dihydrolipoamide acyltransferase (E2) component
MSKREKTPAVGTCPCPETGCSEVIEVRKYRERSGRGSMFKGKFYGNCPAHGRVIDASRPASQEHVLERGEIWGANRSQQSAQPREEPAAQPSPQPSAQPSEPASPEPEPVQQAQPLPRLPALLTPAEPARSRLARILSWNLWDWWPIRSSSPPR